MDNAKEVLSSIGSSLTSGLKSLVKRKQSPKELIQTIQSYLHSLLLLRAAPSPHYHPGATATSPTSVFQYSVSTSHNTPSLTPTDQLAGSTASSVTSPHTNSNAHIPTSPHPHPSSSSSSSSQASSVSTTSPEQQSNTRTITLKGELATSIVSELESIVFILYGDPDAPSKEPDYKLQQEITDLIFEHDLLRRLLEVQRSLEFEARKSFTRVFEFCMTQRRDQSISYIQYRPGILEQLVQAYDEKDSSIVLCSDAILRSCIVCWPLAEMIFKSEPSLVQPFFKYMELPNFEVNSHAFNTFKLLMTEHKDLAGDYLDKNYDTFFPSYNSLLQSDNYLTKLQSFQLLSELLMTPSNQSSMLRYVNSSDHLKLAMISLRGPKAIQMAVFHVLKIFIPNPYKSDSIVRILVQNKKNFFAFLEEFEKETDDEQLISYKQQMLDALSQLPDSLPKTVSPQLSSTPNNNPLSPTASHHHVQQDNNVISASAAYLEVAAAAGEGEAVVSDAQSG